MAIDFPSSPSLDQIFEANGKYWQWDGNSWNAYYNQAAAEKHGGSHSLGGTDPINISQSQVSNLTTDLGNKAPLASPTFTGTVTAPTLSSTTANIATGNVTNLTASTSAALPANTTIGVVSATELSYLDGVTSALQTQLNNKEKSIPLSSSAPLSPESSDLWVDSSSATPILKVYNGTSWVALASPTDDDQNILANQVFR